MKKEIYFDFFLSFISNTIPATTIIGKNINPHIFNNLLFTLNNISAIIIKVNIKIIYLFRFSFSFLLIV